MINLIRVLKVAGPVLSIVGSLVSGYASKFTMQQMIKDEVARMMNKS